MCVGLFLRHLARAFAAFLAWTSLRMRMVSRLTGLGTKPTMPSSFTGRPIHQSLLNFCTRKRKDGILSAAFPPAPVGARRENSNLFDVEEVSGFESDGVARDGDVVIVRWSIREVTTHRERHRFVLQTRFYQKIKPRNQTAATISNGLPYYWKRNVYIDNWWLSRILIFVILTRLVGDILGFVQSNDGVDQCGPTLAFSSCTWAFLSSAASKSWRSPCRKQEPKSTMV